MATYVQDEPGALMLPAAKGGPMRHSGFNTRTRWVDVVKDMGLPGLHFHDLRHTGNMLAAMSGAGLKDLMARSVSLVMSISGAAGCLAML